MAKPLESPGMRLMAGGHKYIGLSKAISAGVWCVSSEAAQARTAVWEQARTRGTAGAEPAESARSATSTAMNGRTRI
jgi:hypothetical protein